MKKNNRRAKNSCVFYRSTLEAATGCGLSAEDELAVLKGILLYALDGSVPKLKGAAKAIFLCTQPLLDKNADRYAVRNRGGAPKGNRNAAKKQKNEGEVENEVVFFDNRETPSHRGLAARETTSRAYDDVNVDDNVDENVNVNADVDVYAAKGNTADTTQQGMVAGKDTEAAHEATLSTTAPEAASSAAPSTESIPYERLTPRAQYERRRAAFVRSIRPYVANNDVGALNDFYLYWAVPNRHTWRMRWEEEAYWDLDMRITDFLQYRARQQAQQRGRRGR